MILLNILGIIFTI